MSSVIFLLIQVILHSVHLTATQQYIGVHFASEGDDVIIRCVISDVSFDGNKFYKVLWLWTPQNSDGKQEILNILKSNGKHTKTSISVNRQRLSDKVTLWAKDKVDYGIFSLVISQVQAEASGNYTCHVKTKNFTHDYITKLFITDGRKELKADFRQIQELGDVNVVLSCKPQRNLCTSHGVSWFFTPLDGKGIKKVIERYQSESGRTYRHWSIKDSFSIQNFKKGDFSLNITSIRREDLGIYKCFVYSRNVHVEITVEMLIQNGISTTIQTKPTEYPNASRGEKTNLLIPILAGTTSTLLIIGIVTLCWCKSSIKGPKRKRLANTSATVAVKMTNVEGRQQHENPLYVSDSVYANNKTRSSGQVRNDAKAKQAQIQVHRNQGEGAGPMGCAGDAEYQDCIYACVSTKLPNSFRCSTKTISELPKYQENLMEDASDELVYAEIDYKMTNDHNASNETSFCA
uniref:Immunoglobulin superfamily 1 n=1 Tax=Eptatretus burgeri TaxID=7764 RepID=Q2ABQ1_EPTBU|nr:immunoglobulin superfamily 1 [Eptatretus burgeri]